MKRTIFTLLVLLVFSISAYAEMGMMGGQSGGMMMGEGQQMPMMQMCMPMMKQMMGQGMMMQDMMQMMMDMMKMQERIMMGVKPAEKKQMMKDMARMREKMQKTMAMRMGMMMEDDSQARLKCAEEWLRKAIDLHDVHIKDPKTATEASQMEMMEQMKKAYECITVTGSMPPKEPEKKEPKKEEPPKPHKH